MRVLVTGASGFIGRAATARLVAAARGEVVAASRRPLCERSAPGFSETAVDLLQPGAAADLIAHVRPTHLLHLAWNATPGAFWTAADNLDWAAATLVLVRAFLDAGGRRAVVAGTCAEYDWTTGAGRLAEDAAIVPATLYGVAKDAARRAVCAAGAARDVPVAWGRVFWLYGPHEARGRLVADVAFALLRGEPTPVGEGLQRRDFMHVDDAAAAFVAALESDHHGPFNVGTGAAAPVRDIVAALAEAAGRPQLIRWGALPPRPEPPLIEADTATLRGPVGAPPARALAVGLANTLEWWRERLETSGGRPSAR